MITLRQIKALCLGLTLAFITSNTALADDPAEVRAAAERYIQSDQMQSMIDGLFSTDAMLAQMGAASPDIPPEFLELIAQIAGEELAAIKAPLTQVMIDAASATYTLEELNAMNAFYESAVGKSAISKTGDYMATAAPGLQANIATMQSRIKARVMALAEEMSGE